MPIHLLAEHVRVVLVEPTHPGNIGAAARAMKNMGLTQLVLVAPSQFPHPDAESRAKGGADLLQRASVVETLAEAIADCQLVIGTSARQRRVSLPQREVRGGAADIVAAIGSGRAPIAILFGREDRGLTNAELRGCEMQLYIPSPLDYSSLNLGMAVQLVCYEVYMAVQEAGVVSAPDAAQPEWPTGAEREHFRVHLEHVLQLVDFTPRKQPAQALAKMHSLFSRTDLTRQELAMLRGFLSSIERSLGGTAPR